MARTSNRDDIIEAGMRVMFRKGYHAAGVRDVVAEAGVPQGSFTNHFRSKEAFAGEVLDHYFAHVRELVGEALNARRLTPRARLQHYLDIITERLARDGYLRGCLIGDLSIEVAQASESLREQLQEIYRAWLLPFERCIAEGQEAGEISAEFPAGELADFLLSSWEGAILRMKVERGPAPLERFKRIAFSTVFAEPA
jgi:TetR/AcrR family transcriptional repressor of nem operon